MKRIIILALLTAMLLAGCGREAAQETLTPEENRLVVYTSHK